MSETYQPLLSEFEQEIRSSDKIIDNIYGVEYYNKKSNSYGVRLLAIDENVIPKDHTYNKSNKIMINGDYIQIMLLDQVKILKKENSLLKANLSLLNNKIDNLENKLK